MMTVTVVTTTTASRKNMILVLYNNFLFFVSFILFFLIYILCDRLPGRGTDLSDIHILNYIFRFFSSVSLRYRSARSLVAAVNPEKKKIR
jgi:hypothetical protein